MTEPHTDLAFSLRSLPGAYAVLLGAGVSTPSGMLSAYGVQRDLIVQLAAVESAEVPDTEDGPFDWYRERFNKEAAYDDLLDRLTTTQHERQALLRGYFEPTAEEQLQGLKQPTGAHQAIARMVASGHIRIILTINFDRLMEKALQEIGIEPTVVSCADDIKGMLPLHLQKALVIHVHGDYLNPTTMLNTPAELKKYHRKVDRLLDRVFDEYGLVSAGWSAKWDPALRKALRRCKSHRFATYWIDPYPLPQEATDTASQRRATIVQASADDFFRNTADALDTLIATNRRHPVTIAVAVETAKRELANDRPAINLHDSLRREASRIADLPLRTDGPWQAPDPQTEHRRRLDGLKAECEKLLALVVAAAYWGSPATDRWWLPDIGRLAELPTPTGTPPLHNLVRAPAVMVLYAAGVAGAAAQRWNLVYGLLTEPKARDHYRSKDGDAAALLSPDAVLTGPRASEGLFHQLQPIFSQYLALGPGAYTEAWERFEYLRLLAQTNYDSQNGKLTADAPHIRAAGTDDSYLPVPSAWFTQFVQRERADLERSAGRPGFHTRTQWDDLLSMQKKYDEAFGAWAIRLESRDLEQKGGAWLPDEAWYPDALQ